MPYITVPVTQKMYQISFDDILNGMNESVFERQMENTHDTRTVYRTKTPQRLLNTVDFDGMIEALQKFNEKYTALISVKDKSTLYKSFKIPKRTGGLRQINAPLDDLMVALRELKYIFEKRLYASYHTSAFAYVGGRSAIDAVKRHQRNKSRWFLKLDFHDFFGSSKPEFILAQLSTIFPFNEILLREDGREALTKALSLCYLNGGLPQGTPISPMLTNLFMIPIDYTIAKMCRETSPHLVYTRYADDMFFSSDLAFEGFLINRIMAHCEILKCIKNFRRPTPEDKEIQTIKVWKVSKNGVPIIYEMGEETGEKKAHSIAKAFKKKHPDSIVRTDEMRITYRNRYHIKLALEKMIEDDKPRTKILSQILSIIGDFNAPFTISDHKTRYGSSTGRNWNLGVMLNSDNQITIGHTKKKVFKTMLFSFMNDEKNNRCWSLEDTQHLQGLISYYRMVERDTIDAIIKSYSEKFNKDVDQTIKEILRAA